MSRRSLVVLGATLVVALAAGCGSDDPVARQPAEPQPATATSAAPPGAITFAGWHWNVKTSAVLVGPGPNRFGDAAAGNVEVDDEGRLHLRINRRDGEWYSAELTGTESTGYGTYTWVIEPPGTPTDPNAVLGLFTWSDDPAQNHREIDIELSHFRRPDSVAGQFVIQPFGREGNVQQFTRATDEPITVSFTWREGEVAFDSPAFEPRSWVYTGSGVPTPGGEVHPRMNLWLLAGDAPANNEELEVIVRRFTYVPLPG